MIQQLNSRVQSDSKAAHYHLPLLLKISIKLISIKWLLCIKKLFQQKCNYLCFSPIYCFLSGLSTSGRDLWSRQVKQFKKLLALPTGIYYNCPAAHHFSFGRPRSPENTVTPQQIHAHSAVPVKAHSHWNFAVCYLFFHWRF